MTKIKPDPSRAIAAKKAQAAANRKNIANAIITMQHDEQRINVQAVARKAGVHPDTVRKNKDLLDEVKRLRDQQWHQKPNPTTGTPKSANYQAMKARWLTAEAEVVDLRKELTQSKKHAHQALGSLGTNINPSQLNQAQQETAELRVQTMDLQRRITHLEDERHDLTAELTAAHQTNRDYVRELNQTRNENREIRQELTKLKTTTSHRNQHAGFSPTRQNTQTP